MTVKEKVLHKIADGRRIDFLPKAKARIDGKIYHYREDKFKYNGKYPFNVNPNTLSADYEIWICGSENLYYLIPKFEIEKIYYSGATPNQTPGQENIITIDIYTSNNKVKIRQGLELDFTTYRNKSITDYDKTVITQPDNIVVTNNKYGKGGESDEHKQLKEWLANNPSFFGLPTNTIAEIDNHTFLSSDRPDIIFTTPDKNFYIVEVEIENCFPGAYQALKYRTLLCAEKGLPLDSEKVKTSLVARVIKQDVKSFCNKYNVLTFEIKK